jgi:hypothetical protein
LLWFYSIVMAEENPELPQKLPCGSQELQEAGTQQSGDATETEQKPDSSLGQLDKTGEKLGNGAEQPPSPAPTPQSAFSVDQLVQEETKKFPTDLSQVPASLYEPGTKWYDAAKLIIFEGLKDFEAIAARAGLTVKTVKNVWRAITKLATEMQRVRGSQGQKPGAPAAPAVPPAPAAPAGHPPAPAPSISTGTGTHDAPAPGFSLAPPPSFQ